MKNHLFHKSILLLFSILCIVSCEVDSIPTDNETVIREAEIGLQNLKEPEFVLTVKIPAIPLIVGHILQREYFHKYTNNPDQTNTISELEYVEQRLVQLYPELVYPGLLKKINAELEEYLKIYDVYLKKQNAYEETLGLPPFVESTPPSFTSLKEEMEYMNMSKTEMDAFLKLEALSTRKKALTREELDKVVKTSGNNKSITAALLTAVAVSLGIPSFRVTQSWNRAESLSQEFYPGNTGPGRKGDAFRHIYVSMHLKRYLSQPVSSAIMGANEVINANDYKGDAAMDLHNNKIGRVTRYREFRGSFFGDLNNWRGWGINIRNFLNGPCENGIPMDIMYNWRNSAPVYPTDIEVAKAEINPSINSRDKRYVYYLRTCPIDRCKVIQCLPGYICVDGNCVVDPNDNQCDDCLPGEECVNGQCRPF